jgi:hypothetical protein
MLINKKKQQVENCSSVRAYTHKNLVNLKYKNSCKKRKAVASVSARTKHVPSAHFVPGSHFNYSASWFLAATLTASGTAIFHCTSNLHLRAATKMTNGVFISNRFLN